MAYLPMLFGLNLTGVKNENKIRIYKNKFITLKFTLFDNPLIFDYETQK